MAVYHISLIIHGKKHLVFVDCFAIAKVFGEFLHANTMKACISW